MKRFFFAVAICAGYIALAYSAKAEATDNREPCSHPSPFCALLWLRLCGLLPS